MIGAGANFVLRMKLCWKHRSAGFRPAVPPASSRPAVPPASSRPLSRVEEIGKMPAIRPAGSRRSECAGRPRPTRLLTPLAFTLLLVSAMPAAAETEWSAKPQRVHLDDSVTITLSLEGDFALRRPPALPMVGLELAGEPSMSSEFSWVNGVSSRRKVVTYEARARQIGAVTIGPLRLIGEDGASLILPQISIEVLKPLLDETDDPETILQRLESASKERVFILAEADKKMVVVGEQVVVTWFLYTADPVRDVHMGGNPPMRDFWVESVPLSGDLLSELVIGTTPVQKLALRRAAIFPGRSGRLEIPPAEAVVEVVRPIDDPFRGLGGGMFRRFEGSVVTVRRRSAPLGIEVTPVPGASSAGVVGNFQIRCSQPKTGEAGPVSFDLVLSGTGNLRSAVTPRFVTPPRGSVEVQEGALSVDRSSVRIAMTRRWRFLLFPREGGNFLVPALTVEAFDPDMASRVTLRCEERTLHVRSGASGTRSVPGANRIPDRSIAYRWYLIAAAGLLTIAGLAYGARRRSPQNVEKDLAEFLGVRTSPSLLRRVLTEQSSRRGLNIQEQLTSHTAAAETFRALHSLIDLMEKEPSTEAGQELEQRARAWLRATGVDQKF